MSFGSNLSSLRKKAGMSQDKLAEQLSISRQAVSKWESGLSSPDTETLIKLCTVLKVSPNQLLLGTDESKAPSLSVKKIDDVFIITSLFLMLLFIGGIAILIMNFTNSFYEPNLTTFAFRLIIVSILLYILLLSVKLSKHLRKKIDT